MKAKNLKITLVLCALLIASLSGCGKEEVSENDVSASVSVEASQEKSTEAPIEVTTENSSEQSAVSSTEAPTEAPIESPTEAPKEDIFASVTCSTMWIEEMTAEEAQLDFIKEDIYDGQTATVVGIMFQDTYGAECVDNIETIEFYRKDGEEYVEIEESTCVMSRYLTENIGVVYGRFPKGAVDVNNLYVRIEKSENYQDKYFAIEPDNCMDMQALNDSNVVVEERGSIFYLQDIPFLVAQSAWDSTGTGGYGDGLHKSTEIKHITIIPLVCLSQYDFSITDSSTASGVTETEDYVITYKYAWARQNLLGTILGTEVELEFELGKIYSDEQKTAFEQENSSGNFFTELSQKVYGQKPLDNMCIVLENQNREDTQLYISYSKFMKKWAEN